MTEPFVIRPDPKGFSVYEVWTGHVAVIAMTPWSGLSREDVEHAAEILNRRAANGDLTVDQ